MRRLLYGLGNFLLTILIIVVVCYGWVYVEQKFMAKPYPEIFDYTFYLVKDNTMAPDLVKDDVVIIDKKAKYDVGDSILFRSADDDKYKVHKIVTYDGSSTTTKCNTCEVEDKPIDSTQIVGKAIAKLSYVGIIIRYLTKKEVLLGLLIGGLLLELLSGLFKYKPKVKKVEPKKTETNANQANTANTNQTSPVNLANNTNTTNNTNNPTNNNQ